MRDQQNWGLGIKAAAVNSCSSNYQLQQHVKAGSCCCSYSRTSSINTCCNSKSTFLSCNKVYRAHINKCRIRLIWTFCGLLQLFWLFCGVLLELQVLQLKRVGRQVQVHSQVYCLLWRLLHLNQLFRLDMRVCVLQACCGYMSTFPAVLDKQQLLQLNAGYCR